MATIATVTLNPAVDRTLEVPNFQPGDVYRGTLKAFRAAGKGVNVSSVLAALGRPSVALGFVGLHEQSFFRASLHPALVDCRLAAVEGVTRHHTTIIDPARQTETHLREQGFRVNEMLVRELKRSIAAVLRGGDFCIFSGSLPAGMTARSFVDLVRSCTQVGARVIVDAEGEPLAGVLNNVRLDFIKPNVRELGQLTRGGAVRSVAQMIHRARQLCSKRLKTVLVSWGDRGAYLVTPGDAWHAHVAVPREQFVNSVGAGDALVAGFVAGMNDGRSVPEALRLAVAAAAADCLTYAAGDVDPAVVARFEKEAQVQEVDKTALTRKPARKPTMRKKK